MFLLWSLGRAYIKYHSPEIGTFKLPNQPTSSLRFCIIDYLNALPLNLAFKDGLFQNRAKLIFDYPSQCADHLASGDAEVGLISSIEYQRIPYLQIASGICIASRQEVRSVLILTRKDLADVSLVALDRFSRSSVALLRILFQRRYGHCPQLVTMTPDPEEMLGKADAALVIGDAALNIQRDVNRDKQFQIIDLASLWYEETGLPFVFAFWALSRAAASEPVSNMLAEAKHYGIQQIPKRIADIQSRWPLSEVEILEYFNQNIHYDLGLEEKASLDRFYRYAFEVGLIHEIKKPKFV